MGREAAHGERNGPPRAEALGRRGCGLRCPEGRSPLGSLRRLLAAAPQAGRTPLIAAVQYGNSSAALQLLEDPNLPLNSADQVPTHLLRRTQHRPPPGTGQTAASIRALFAARLSGPCPSCSWGAPRCTTLPPWARQIS